MNSKIIIAAIIVISVIGLGGIFLWRQSSPAPTNESEKYTEPISYTANDQLFTVSKKEFQISEYFIASDLANKSLGCGNNKTEQYFTDLLNKYPAGSKGIEYDFQYSGKTQYTGRGQDTWIVMVIPNNLGYNRLEDFVKNFDICEAGAAKYSMAISQKYLFFKSSCGSGGGDDMGCTDVQQFVEPTIKFH